MSTDHRNLEFDTIEPGKVEPIQNFSERYGFAREITVNVRVDWTLYLASPSAGSLTYQLVRYKREQGAIRRYDGAVVGSGTLLTFAEIKDAIGASRDAAKTVTVGPFDEFVVTHDLDVPLLGLELEFDCLSVRVETENETRMLGREDSARIIRDCGAK